MNIGLTLSTTLSLYWSGSNFVYRYVWRNISIHVYTLTREMFLEDEISSMLLGH